MMWFYGSGFPKSLDISKTIDKARKVKREVIGNNPNARPNQEGKQPLTMSGKFHYEPLTVPTTELTKLWNGWGTALKPAWEPIIVAMKPLDGTFAENAEKWGVAGLNIDGGRIRTTENCGRPQGTMPQPMDWGNKSNNNGGAFQTEGHSQGRWPANVLLDEEAAKMLDEQSGELHSNSGDLIPLRGERDPNIFQRFHMKSGRGRTDSGGASRFFYVAKASRSERNEGLEDLQPKKPPLKFGLKDSEGTRATHKNESRQNFHPTVKPLKLMEYLCKLTKTPTGGIVLDCFGGSGTTALACINTGRRYILIEKDAEYCELAKRRITCGGLFIEKIENSKL